MQSDEQGGFPSFPPFPSLAVGNINTSWAGRWVFLGTCSALAKQVVQESMLAEPSAVRSAGTPWELRCQADTELLVKL